MEEEETVEEMTRKHARMATMTALTMMTGTRMSVAVKGTLPDKLAIANQVKINREYAAK